MAVDISPLQNAMLRLEEALVRFRQNPADTIVRDALIQRFEFTYDLAPKMLRRVLARRSDTPDEIDRLSFAGMMRTAFEQGLVDKDWTDWLDYRDKRTITSHTYDEIKAMEVAEVIPAFFDKARALVEVLKRHGAE